jgi:Uma2 family endonuclease
MAIGFITAAEMQNQLGGIPLERIRVVPPAGLATEADLLRVQNQEGRTCELIDGTLVEKTMGYYESMLALTLGYFLKDYLKRNDLGILLGADGALRILADQIRIPDIAFISWRHFPGRVLPSEPVPSVAPDLAVEVLSAGNTNREMERKLDDYFAAGVLLAWFIEPTSQSITVYESRQRSKSLTIQDTLDGGNVLPGFQLPIKQLFDEVSPYLRRQ